MRVLTYVAAIAATLTTTAVQGHEYWIDPVSFSVEAGEALRANTRVGQFFEGAPQIYNPNRYQRFEIVSGDDIEPITGTLGDRPAISQDAPEGLAIVVAVTTSSRLTYNDFEKFEAFVDHKAARWVPEAHRERGLPDKGFVEAYSRYAKSLVAVGDGAGSDRAIGLETEIVALKNPYTDDLTDGLPVEVTYRGAPRAGEQVEIFDRGPDGSVTVSTVTTDDVGRALIPVRPGHAYMLDSVVLREPTPDLVERYGAVWESLWANLTFAVPE